MIASRSVRLLYVITCSSHTGLFDAIALHGSEYVLNGVQSECTCLICRIYQEDNSIREKHRVKGEFVIQLVLSKERHDLNIGHTDFLYYITNFYC